MSNVIEYERCNILKHIESEDFGRTVAVDTETTGLNKYQSQSHSGKPARAFYVSFTNGDGLCDGVRFDVNPFTRAVNYKSNPKGFRKIRKVLEDETVTKVFHNAPFDIGMFEAMGVKTNGAVYDTRIMAHVENSSRRSFALKPLTKSLLNIDDGDQQDLKDSVKKARAKGKKLGWIISKDLEADYFMGDPVLCDTYGVGDTYRTMALYWVYRSKYDNDPVYRSLVDMERNVQRDYMRMSDRGISTSLTNTLKIKKYYEDLLVSINKDKERLGYGALNTNSPKQMINTFYEDLNEEVIINRKTDKPTCNGKALLEISCRGGEGAELAKLILRLNASKHQYTNFVLPVLDLAEGKERVIHPNYNTVGPVTGRISCKKPNMMNVSSSKSAGRKTDVEYKARECFVPRKNKALYFPDYSQVEIWVAMFLARDEVGMKALTSGTDMHAMLATKIWSERDDFEENFDTYRKMAKMAGFGMLYGGGPKAIQELAGCSFNEAVLIREKYLQQFKGIASYIQKITREVKRFGYVTNPFGRRYYVPSNEAYKAFNYMIQGTAADIMKRASINVTALCDDPQWAGCDVLLSIHDELCVEVPLKLHSKKLMQAISDAMSGDFHHLLKMPNKFPVGMKFTTTNWSEMTEIEDLTYAKYNDRTLYIKRLQSVQNKKERKSQPTSARKRRAVINTSNHLETATYN